MFSFTVSFKKNNFYDMNEIFPVISILPFTLFKSPISMCKNDLLPECFLPSNISLSPGSTATYYVM